MKSYDVENDIDRIREFFSLSKEEFAKRVGLTRETLYRYSRGLSFPSANALEKIYGYAYSHGLLLNEGKSAFFEEEAGNRVLLFHGARGRIEGDIYVLHSKANNDFGMGFYAGTLYKQASTWVSETPGSSVYAFYFNAEEVGKGRTFLVGREWMYAILFYRGAFDGYALNEDVSKIVEEVENSSYLVAPIADNQMYRILNRFCNCEITDEACLHALAASNLGLQYVFKSMEACKKLVPLDRLYLCERERTDLGKRKEVFSKEGDSKAELAMVEYRRKGRYFDELFKRL